MKWNSHFQLSGSHAFLSPSQYHWINYSNEKLVERYLTKLASEKGSELHSFASMAITNRIRLERRGRNSLAAFVNDAIGFRMESEQTLYYSENAYGTADAISFRSDTLKIHDLKTGNTKASFVQLIIYAALFCLEYKKEPEKIKIELRIYQGGEIEIYIPEPEEVRATMMKIISFDKIIKELSEMEGDNAAW